MIWCVYNLVETNLREVNLKNKILKGTTTVGLKVKDGVVLAADRRASAGVYVAHKYVRKVLYVTDTIGVTTAGSVADIQFVYEILKNIYNYNKISGSGPITVKGLAMYLGTMLSRNKYFPYLVQILLGGYDESGASLYNLDYIGDVTEERYTATGSGSPVAVGVLEDGYREDLTLDEAADLAKRAVFSAIKRDSFTGTGVIVTKLSKNGHEEKEYYIKKNTSIEQ
ncbi:archaeal proteasome endopeptidase complex subunit beta [Sulfolobus metallicus DSM 6482 = JCM 9184]|uniref:Proteasome subunit beta n=1 Tax=Sulfuracidifex metallicus DSM 6482 = JCM 9184 TaxID=523847 RepID=A0A6A9QLK9_SULME|nr:archaeal proteasome endopeptidase complex subunit beta [Sulfuracidifex metallicus]MUN28071.1 archaeal proteasome endopeptidase complex subunit beta [Sulfuracidifex metallicus DSM 6482 = JCM 9184]